MRVVTQNSSYRNSYSKHINSEKYNTQTQQINLEKELYYTLLELQPVCKALINCLLLYQTEVIT